jgi:glycosyltransferase involved in cell wall biosynthesis
MACIVKLPSAEHKGVITFTTQERDRFISGAPRVEKAIGRLRRSWLVGLHHNWHDFAFRYNPLFDFSMAGEADLIERDGRPFALVPMDACNFSPLDFHPPAPGGEKFWDVLTVARPVFFKRLPLFLETIRRLYDRRLLVRVLCICPLPPYRRSDRKTIFYELEQRHQAMFTAEERKYFNLWVPRHDYPFPLDLTTLAHLYRASRVFVHTANDERRCRVAAYAWSSGLPVVAMDAVASLLPGALQRPPFWFKVDRDDGYADAIMSAIAATREATDFAPVRALMSEEHTRGALADRLKALLARAQPAAAGLKVSDFALDRLDIRLGRHCEYEHTANTLRLPLELFLEDLESGRLNGPLDEAMSRPDPERFLEERLGATYDAGRCARLARAHRRRELRVRAGRLAEGLHNRARRYFHRA